MAPPPVHVRWNANLTTKTINAQGAVIAAGIRTSAVKMISKWKNRAAKQLGFIVTFNFWTTRQCMGTWWSKCC